MKIIDYIQVGLNILVVFLMIIILIKSTKLPERKPDIDDVKVELQQPYFFLTEVPNDSLVMKALQYYEIKYPEIVLAQAVLETGHYRSKLCKESNNLFGLYNNRKKDYFHFIHWSESVEAYKNFIQYKYQEGEDYYNFLSRIGYASDTLYIPKLKTIVKRYETN